MTHSTALSELRRAYPWPKQRSDLRPVPWGLDAGGRQLVVDQIRERQVSVVLEIGVFLGGSARLWLEASPNVIVLAVDPWDGGLWTRRFARKHRQPEWVGNQLGQYDNALFETFIVNMWDYRERVVPIRAKALDVLHEIHRYGVVPELVYLDGDKSGRELEICHTLFPDAVLSGDDWFMGTDRFWNADDGYPIRKPVREFVRRHRAHLSIDRHTWVVTREPPPLRHMIHLPGYHLKQVRRRLRGAFRWAAGLEDAAKSAAL